MDSPPAPADLLDAARRAAACWGVTLGPPLLGGTQGAVLSATTRSGGAVVVKAAIAEQAALERRWLVAAHDFTVALLDHRRDDVDSRIHVLLLERAGVTQPWDVQRARFQATAQQVLRTSRGCPTTPALTSRFPTAAAMVHQRRRWVHELAEAGRCEPLGIDPGRWTAAVDELVPEACAVVAGSALLHGDAQAKNLVRRGGTWVLIDPMPCIGAVEFDLAPLVVTGSGSWPVRAAAAFARGLPGIDRARLDLCVRFLALSEAVWGEDRGQPERLHPFLEELGLLPQIRLR